MSKKRLLIITNLYPTPWAPNRASFNRQQFAHLEAHFEIKKIILLPFIEWFKNRKKIKKSENEKFIPFFYLPKIGRRFYPLFQLFSLLFLLPFIKRFLPQAILASWGYPDAIAASKLARLLDIDLFIKIHGTDINGNIQIPSRAKQIVSTFNRAQAILSVSQALKQVLVEYGVQDEKVHVVYNGVNKDVFYPSDLQNKNTIVFVGNLIPEKGVRELIAAYKRLSEIRSDVKLKIIGQGPLSIELESMKGQLANPDNLQLMGSIALELVAKELRESSVLVLPSYREGVPNVILESLASGVPVVASNVGGIPEVLSSNAGIIVDNLATLDEALLLSLNKNWDKASIQEESNQFEWQNNANQVKQIIG